MSVVLDIRGLGVTYFLGRARIEAVQDVTLAIAAGERLGLVGESGSGKTTLALAVMGLLRAPGRITGGQILLAGRDLVPLTPQAHAALRPARISYVPQGAMNALNPVLRIRRSMRDVIGRENAHRIPELLDQVGLPASVANRYPHELSGGMKQRVCIALAISLGPQLIVADEPTSALDVVTQRQVMRTLQTAQERLDSALLLIGHDMGLMAQSVHRMAVMRGGRMMEQGPTASLFHAPATPYTAELIRSVPVIDGSAQPAPPALAGPDLLRFEAVSKSYGGGLLRPQGFTALHTLSFSLPAAPPRIVSVVGQSGSGKSTIGALILGFIRPSRGVVRYQGQDISALRGRARTAYRREVQAIFQDPYSAFNPFYRVERSLTQPLRSFRLAASGAEARARAEAACRDVGLAPEAVLDRFPHQLSGGQRQRLMVARALLLRPRLLVADEPVSMVDASLRAAILELLVELRDRHGISNLYITHDLATAYRVSDEVMVLRAGRVVEAGDPAEIFERPEHPYTRLLIDCLPWPDPSRNWGSPEQESLLRQQIDALDGAPTVLRRPAATRLRQTHPV